MVEKSKEYIKDGDIFQILPSQKFEGKFDENNAFTQYIEKQKDDIKASLQINELNLASTKDANQKVWIQSILSDIPELIIPALLEFKKEYNKYRQNKFELWQKLNIGNTKYTILTIPFSKLLVLEKNKYIKSFEQKQNINSYHF